MKQLFISAILALSLVGCASEPTQPITYTGLSYKYRVEAGIKRVGHGFNTVVYTNHIKHLGGDCYQVVAHRSNPDRYHLKEGDTIVLCKVLLITQQ